MTKSTKRLLFYFAVIIFLFLGYSIVLFAQGYKYDFNENKFFLTGAIDIEANVSVKVFLDDRLEGNTSFFNNSLGINGLLPGRYEVRLQKDGYSIWQKRITVEEGLVSSFSNILLLPLNGDENEKLIDEIEEIFSVKASTFLGLLSSPSKDSNPSYNKEATKQKPEFYIKKNVLFRSSQVPSDNEGGSDEKLAENVLGFVLSKNKNKLAWWNKNEIWIIWLQDMQYQPFYKKGDEELITRFSISIKDLAWFRGENYLVSEFELKDSRGRPYTDYKIVEIDNRGGVNITEI